MRPSRALVLWPLVLLAWSISVTASEYFGEFPDPLDGEFRDATPRPLFRLNKKFRFLDPNGLSWEVPATKEVDGASVPQIFWSMIGGPFSGNYIKASVIHDYYCDEKLRTAHDTHRSFYYGMLANGVEGWRAKLMYWAVATFGPQWALEKRVVYKQACKTRNGQTTCAQRPIVETRTVAVEQVDLEDPATASVALSKLAAVAKTLQTTDGAILDVSINGEVSGELGNINQNAMAYRALFSTGRFQQAPHELGLMAEWEGATVTSWADGDVPPLEEAPYLSSIEQGMDANAGFRVNAGDLQNLETDFETLRFEMEL